MKIFLDIIVKLLIVITAFLVNGIKNQFDNLASQVRKNTIEIEVLKEKLKIYNESNIKISRAK